MSIKQNGGVFGRNPTFNDVTIEGQLTFDGDIDINSDLKVDGDLDVTGTAIVDKLGINAPTPASALDVVGANKDAIRIRSTVASNQYYQVGRNQSTGLLELKGSEATYNGYLFKGPSSDLMEITAAGNVSVSTGNLVIGTSGKGIDFSATAGTGTSELLDDYEEGTWTPTLVGASSAGTYSIAASGCTYTKVGRLVTVMGKMTITVTSAGSGSAKFGGLPFTTSGDPVAVGTAISKNVDLNNSTVSMAVQPWTSNTAEFAIVSVRDNSTTATLDVSGISTSDFIIINTTYIT